MTGDPEVTTRRRHRVKAAIRGWFGEFIGNECAATYIGPVAEADRAAWRRLRRRLLFVGFAVAATLLATIAGPVGSSGDGAPATPKPVAERYTHFDLDPRLGDAGTGFTGPGLPPGERRLRLDSRLGTYSQLLLRQGLAD